MALHDGVCGNAAHLDTDGAIPPQSRYLNKPMAVIPRNHYHQLYQRGVRRRLAVNLLLDDL